MVEVFSQKQKLLTNTKMLYLERIKPSKQRDLERSYLYLEKELTPKFYMENTSGRWCMYVRNVSCCY
jgi:hypothetical protein